MPVGNRSRKRSLAVIGTTSAAAAAAVLLLQQRPPHNIATVTASPILLRQSRIRRTSRNVKYYLKNDDDYSIRPAAGDEDVKLLVSDERNYRANNEDRWTFLHADASVEHPDPVFAEIIRKRTSQEEQQQRTATRRSSRKMDKNRLLFPWRHLESGLNDTTTTVAVQEEATEEDFFYALGGPAAAAAPANPNSNAFVSDERGDDALIMEDTDNSNSQSDTTTLTVGFNITSDTEFDVSAGTGSANSTDTAAVVFTDNQQANTLSPSSNSNTTSLPGDTDSDSGTSSSTNEKDTENVPDPTDAATSIPAATATDASSTKVPTKIFRPLRMRAFLSEVAGGGQHLPDDDRVRLLQGIIRPALLSWSAALRVQPVVGNLTVDPHQLVDGHSCGAAAFAVDDDGYPTSPPHHEGPTVVVPASHMTMGVPDTDFILYISLAFVTEGEEEEEEQDQQNKTTSASSTSPLLYQGNSTSGNTDPSISPSIEEDIPTKKQVCTGDYLAASTFCSTDQYERPTAALLHLCIGPDFFQDVPTRIMLVMHELGHALGFNAVSLAHFRKPDGTVYTQRDANGEIPLTKINCVGPVSPPLQHDSDGNTTTASTTTSTNSSSTWTIIHDYVQLPSPELLQFRTVRGGVRVAQVVSPNVAQAARNHFDCQELPGAELESGEFLPLTNTGQASCLGDHWERRLFKTDLMNPLVDESMEFNPRFSTITLAYFADSGWYQVDLSRATLAAGWGRAAGCDFVEETCIQTANGQVPPKYHSFFCNKAPAHDEDEKEERTGNFYTSDIHGCTPDLTRKASCSLDRWDGELPPAYQYFNVMYGSNVGGNDPFMDYCPVYSGFANGLCSDPENEALIKVNMVERFGRRNSRCLSGRVTRLEDTDMDGDTERGEGRKKKRSQSSSSDTDSQKTRLTHEETALCLPIACVVEDRSLRVQVNGEWRVCSKQGEIIRPRAPLDTDRLLTGDGIASIECPDPIRICPTFYCTRDCLGTDRICDYRIGKCVCPSISNSTDLDLLLSQRTNLFNRPCDVSANGDSDNTEQPSSSGSFYIPEVDDSDGLPSPDSPLADYYVPTARNLEEERHGFWTRQWKAIVSGASLVALIVSFILGFVIYRRDLLIGPRSGGDGGDGGNNAETLDSVDPNKHKMMASVVVDMRINDPSLQARADVLGGRDSETELSMTTEGTDVGNHLSRDLSAFLDSTLHSTTTRGTMQEGTIADLASEYRLRGRLDSDEDQLNDDPLAPPTSRRVFRRRHIPPWGNSNYIGGGSP